MRRTSYRPLVALGLVAGLLTYVGCSSPRSDADRDRDRAGSAPAGAAGSGGAPSAAGTGTPPKGTKLASDWPTPEAVLVVSGEQFGYLEPCGCTLGQLGGLKRRYDLIAWLRDQQKWPLALIDLGSLIKDPAGARGGFEESKLKFDAALKALGIMKYDALALSAEDLKVGTDEALMRYLNTLGERTKVIAANVRPAQGFETVIRPSLTITAGKARLGITAVLDPNTLKRLPDPARDAMLPEVKTPEEVLPGILADLEKETQLQVLMVQGPPELARTLGEKFPGFDVVVGTSRFDPAEDAERLNEGKTLLVNVGHKGQYVGLVGLFPDNDPKQRLRYQWVTLGTKFNGPAEPIHDLIENELPSLLKTTGVVENFPRHDFVGGAPGARFAGVESCRSCHPNTVAKWATTKHARAFDDIVNDPHGLRSDHQFDAECVSCHTTGFEYTSGWKSAALTPHLKGNQCENCHGPASKHVEEPDNPAIRKTIALTAADADHNRRCLSCHDGDNSPKFDFTTYWSQIAHKGLDQYNDPEVHRGHPVKVAGKPGS